LGPGPSQVAQLLLQSLQLPERSSNCAGFKQPRLADPGWSPPPPNHPLLADQAWPSVSSFTPAPPLPFLHLLLPLDRAPYLARGAFVHALAALELGRRLAGEAVGCCSPFTGGARGMAGTALGTLGLGAGAGQKLALRAITGGEAEAALTIADGGGLLNDKSAGLARSCGLARLLVGLILEKKRQACHHHPRGATLPSKLAATTSVQSLVPGTRSRRCKGGRWHRCQHLA
jgi:hypothetical protein